MKILLINPPELKEIYSEYEESAPKLPPLGICYIASVLIQQGHKVSIIDCIAESLTLDELKNRIKMDNPDLIGITATTIMFNSARIVANCVKEFDRRIITVLGGAHVSALPEETILQNPQFDFGVIGEGELTMAELVERLEQKGEISDVSGLIWCEDGRVNDWKRRGPIQNLDSLPFPSRQLLKDLRLYRPPITRSGGRLATSVITSRGCPIGCAFCDQTVFGRSWRAHSASYVIRELIHLQNNFGVDFVTFEDDFFLCSKTRVAELCDRIKSENLRMGWGCSVRVDSVNDEIAEKMKEAGCKYMFVGIESGSSRILKMVDKSQTMEGIKKGVRLIKSHGIRVIGSVVIGFPTETKEDVRKTVSLVLSLPLDGLSFFIYTPFPNTLLYDFANRHGRISTDWQKYSSHPSKLAYVPDGLSEAYLLSVQRRTYMRFFLRPCFLLRHLPSMLKWSFIKRVLSTVGRMMFRGAVGRGLN
jgi:anaerobic magnesium-protoporphyrin IX monomethyl ester cyclase